MWGFRKKRYYGGMEGMLLWNRSYRGRSRDNGGSGRHIGYDGSDGMGGARLGRVGQSLK